MTAEPTDITTQAREHLASRAPIETMELGALRGEAYESRRLMRLLLPLSDDQRELLRSVFDDAFSERDDSGVPRCEDCAAAAGPLCTGHANSLDTADRYHQLAIALGVLPPGPLIGTTARKQRHQG